MAHELTRYDGLYLAHQSAWHGLGTVWPANVTPEEGLRISRIDWSVDQHPMLIQVGDRSVPVPGYRGNYRSDIDVADPASFLGMVSDNYNPVQNLALAKFCYDLRDAGAGEVTCETVGSIQGGRRVWFLLKTDAIKIGGDEVVPYLLVSNSHDGSASVRITPTTVRVVCSNTLHMVVPRQDNGRLDKAAMAYRHTDSIHSRLEAAKAALAAYNNAKDATVEVCEKMIAVKADDEMRQKFFFARYEDDFGKLDMENAGSIERAGSAYASFTKRWDDEADLHQNSIWGMLNAYTGMVQNDQKARGKDDADRIQRRWDSNLFGLNIRRTQAAFMKAAALATAS